MRVTFILPGYWNQPSGGYKVIYEYANRFQNRGHQVTIALPCAQEHMAIRVGHPVKRFIREVLWATQKPSSGHAITWFQFASGVRVECVPEISNAFIPAADAIIFSGYQAADAVAKLSGSKGRKFYLVYDYEFWMTGDSTVRQLMARSYQLGMNLIATSPSVRAMLLESRAQIAAYIPCGMDLEQFGVDVPIAHRDPYSIGFPYREEVFKGTVDALRALDILRFRHGPRVKGVAFGAIDPLDLPEYVEYWSRPSDAELRGFYNSIGIFLFPSHYEGWGLPGMEALACGAALVAADSVGLRDYATQGETAILVDKQRPDLLASAVDRLLQNDEMRQRIARQGGVWVQRYTWDRAVDALEGLLREARRPAR